MGCTAHAGRAVGIPEFRDILFSCFFFTWKMFWPFLWPFLYRYGRESISRLGDRSWRWLLIWELWQAGGLRIQPTFKLVDKIRLACGPGKFQALFGRGDGFGGPARLGVGQCQIIKRSDVVGSEAQGLVKLRDCFLGLACLEQCGSQVIARHGIIGLKAQGFAKMFDSSLGRLICSKALAKKLWASG